MNSLYTDPQGRNALHALAARGQMRLALKTISGTPKGVVVQGLQAKDNEGCTPMHIAAYCGHLRVLRAFYDACAEAMDVRDALGNSAWDALRRAPATGPRAREFLRFVWIEPPGMRYERLSYPTDVWDVSLSANSAVAVMRSSWGGPPVLCASVKGALRLFDVPDVRFVATSNKHSLAVSADRCYAWGKNLHGELGLPVEKATEPTLLPVQFAEYAPSSGNAYSALESAAIRVPLLGATCADGHSCVYTAHAVYAWGANRGQMRGATEESMAPHAVLNSQVAIRAVRAGDSMLAVLLTTGTVQVLVADTLVNLNAWEIESLEVKGAYLLLLTSQGKLLRTRVGVNGVVDKFVTVWTPRREKDTVCAYDVSEAGYVVIATRACTYKLVGKELNELKFLRGFNFTQLRTDQYFRRFVGVHRISAGFGYLDFQKRKYESISEEFPQVFEDDSTSETDTLPDGAVPSPGPTWDLERDLQVEIAVEVSESDGSAATRETAKVHSAMLFAACPGLRPLLLKEASSAAVPGGSTVFTWSGTGLRAEHAPECSVRAFIDSLYGECPALDGAARHELHALMRLVDDDGSGLWAARAARIGCDVLIDDELAAHSVVLRAASPVLEAQLTRWSKNQLPAALFPSNETQERVLHFIYTRDINRVTFSSDAGEYAEELFELWQTADELLIPPLYTACERRLFETVTFTDVVPFLRAAEAHGTSRSRFYGSLIDVVARSMPYFIASLTELSAEATELIEKLFKQFDGTKSPDAELAESFDKLKSLSLDKEREMPSRRRTVSTGILKAADDRREEVKPKKDTKKDVSFHGTDGNDDEKGWVQARKKTRSKSQPTQERVVLRSPAKQASVLTTSTPPPTLPAAAVPLVPKASTPGPLDSLPVLGTKVATTRNPRMRFNSKDDITHFEDPFMLVQQLVHEQNQNPWKRIPRPKKK